MRIKILVVFIFIHGVLSAGTPISLSPEMISELKHSVEWDAPTKALLNAVTNNDVKNLAFNRELYLTCNEIFNHQITTKGITDQKKSGRCWIFAALNIMRPMVVKKYNLTEFEFSQNYLFFWDKLEKANMFLEAIIETANRDIDDRELQALLDSPVPDGGWWSYVVQVIEKYGVAPKQFMPDTKNSDNSSLMNSLVDQLMRHHAVEIRRMVHAGTKEKAMHDYKLAVLKDVYRILVLHLGAPPEQFTWRYTDKDNKIFSQRYTPLSFYNEAVGVNLKEYVSIFNYPVHPFNKRYRINFCRNMTDMPDMDFINLEIDKLKTFTMNALLHNEPIWFAADVGQENDNSNGILAVGIYDMESLFGVNSRLTKAQRISYRESTPNHAMAFVGVDTVDNHASKWRVENSWGADRGSKGYWTMLDNWFDEYVFTVIIPKQYLPDDVLDMLKMKPEILPAWDPMRTAFR